MLNLIDTKLQEMKAMESTPSTFAHVNIPIPQWMSEESLWLIDALAALRCRLDHKRNVDHTMMWAVWRYLTVDYCRRAEVYAEDIDTCMETPQVMPPDLQGVHIILKRWYLHALERQPHPSRADLEKVSWDYTEIYKQ